MTAQPAGDTALASPPESVGPQAQADAPAELQGGGQAPEAPPPALRRRLLLLAGLGVVLALLLYYPVGAWRAHAVDDDPSFAPAQVAAGQSQAVAVAAALIRREIDQHGWAPNKPFFMPVAILDDMPAFQKGIIAAVGRFAMEMDERIGRRSRPDGGPEADADLSRAAGLLQYPANVWMIDPAVPWATTISTEKQYRNAARALEAYNQRLPAGDAAFVRRPEVLQAVLERFAKDLDGAAATLDGVIGRGGGWFHWHASQPYYGAKGRAYGSLLLLRALGEDFAPVLDERNLGEAWRDMLSELAAAAQPRPWVVLVGAADSTLVPNHPAVLGYHLLRARSRLAGLAEALG